MDRRRSVRYPLSLRTQVSFAGVLPPIRLFGVSENVSRTGLLAKCIYPVDSPVPPLGTFVTVDLEMFSKNARPRSLCCEGVIVWMRWADDETLLIGVHAHQMYFRDLPIHFIPDEETADSWLKGIVQ